MIAASVVLTLLFDLPMQEVKNVIMESTDVSALEVSEEKKTHANESKNAESVKTAGHDTEEEIVPTLKKVNGKRTSFIDHDSDETSSKERAKVATRKPSRDTEGYADRKIGINSQKYATDDSEEEAIEFFRSQREHDEAPRNRRSLSRSKDNKRPSSRNSESEEEWQRRKKIEDDTRQFRRSESRGKTSAREADDYRSWEFVGKEGSSAKQHESKPLRSDIARKTFSSESEDEPSAQGRTKPACVSSSEAKVSDEEEWECELRIRRKQFMEKLIAQQRESLVEGENEGNMEPLRRRSSAEGRIALLSDDISGEDNMDSWTVSVGPRIMLLGSSQEPSEPEEDGMYMRRKEYREQGPPSREESLSEEESQDTSRRQSYTSGSQKTSLEEEDDINSYNFILTKGSKRESLQDLSQLSQEELASAGWNVVKREGEHSLKPTGLFKRESIVKSQASEEDPEYLLPERPKLVQQEREHPLKKAWQMQKSKSEEEGSSAYTIKDSKEQQSETKVKEPAKREYSSQQSEDTELFANDESVEVTVVLRGRSTDTEDTRTSSTRSGTDETDSVSTDWSGATREGNHRQKSETDEDSAKFNWPGEREEEMAEDEIYEAGRRGMSEETDWDWEREET